MESQEHHIRKTLLRFELTSAMQQNDTFKSDVEEIKEYLVETIGKALDQADDSEAYYLIDRIDVNLEFSSAVFTVEGFLREFSGKMVEQIKRQINGNPKKLESPVMFESAAKLSGEEFVLFQIKMFLLTGHQQSLLKNSSDWDEAIFNIVSSQPASFTHMINEIYDHPIAIKRLCMQTSNKLFRLILVKCFRKSFTLLNNLLNELIFFANIRLTGSELNRFEQLVKYLLLKISLIGFEDDERFIRNFAKQLYREIENDSALLTAVRQTMPDLLAWQRFIIREISNKNLLRIVLEHFVEMQFLNGQQKSNPQTGNKLSLNVFDSRIPIEKLTKKKTQDYSTSDVWYCRNAGLILLHPYLQAYFNEYKLLNNGKFIDGFSRIQAMHLLNYLTWGKTEYFEGQMTLNKILCDYQPDIPVPRWVELPEGYESEGLKMLEAAIRHWKKLRNTSAEALQENFLQREGKIELKENYWLLTVEKKPYDVLLAHLPWTITQVVFPWMEKRIQVNWQFSNG